LFEDIQSIAPGQPSTQAAGALTAADIVARGALEAFELLIYPDRIKAVLRG